MPCRATGIAARRLAVAVAALLAGAVAACCGGVFLGIAKRS
jgi:hypothetical protein